MRIDIGQIEFIHQSLRQMIEELEDDTGFEFTVTSLYRINDSGVHGQLPLRGTDLRCRNETVGLVLEQHINQKWLYDPERPSMRCAILHGEGSNMHLHLQSHPNTVRI